MSRYIDADLLKVVLVMSDKTGKMKCGDMRKVIESVDDIPTADVVEVVRCKDCKHLFEDNKCPLRTWWKHTEDDYCSYGERAEEC